MGACASSSFSNPRQTRTRSSNRPRQAPGPGLPAQAQPSPPLPRLRAGGLRGRSTRSAPARAPPSTCSAGPPARDAPGRPEAPVPEGGPARALAPLGTHLGAAEAGGRGAAPGRRGAGRAVFGLLPALPAGALRPRLRAGPRATGPSPARAVAERGAGGAAAVVFEPRSPKQQRWGGGEGEGRGPGGPRGAAGPGGGFGGAGFRSAGGRGPGAGAGAGAAGRGWEKSRPGAR